LARKIGRKNGRLFVAEILARCVRQVSFEGERHFEPLQASGLTQ
jgi:hypothetical protein